MKKQLISFLLTCTLLAVSLASNATIHYVYPGGSGSQDGISWGDAAPDIQYLLTPSNFPAITPLPPPHHNPLYPKDGDTIFVAQGTYDHICLHFGGYNVNGVTTNRSYLSKLHIFGGFKGTETSLTQRTNWRLHPSIISPSNGGHAVWFEGGSYLDPITQQIVYVPMEVEFDGFTITNTASNKDALRMVFVAAWISNVQITKNNGLPIFAENLPNSTTLHDETFTTATLMNVAIYDNAGINQHASVMVAASSYIDFRNVTAVRNKCTGNNSTPAIFHFYSNPSDFKILNTILWGNSGSNRIIDNTTGVQLHSGYSIIEDFTTFGSDWNSCIDYGNTNDINPMITYPYYFTPTSSAYRTAYLPFYKKYMSSYWASLTPPQPWVFYNYDIDGNYRFNNPDKLDIGAWQYRGDSKYGVDDKYFKDTIQYGNIKSSVAPESNTSSTIYTAGTTVPIFNLPEASHVMLFDIQGRMLNRNFVVNNEFSMQTPSIPGIYFIVVENNGAIVNTTKIIVTK